MKKIAIILILSMVTVLSAEAHKHSRSNFAITYQTFYNELSPYGDWIYAPDYGYVWRPYFDYPDAFRPYSSNGNWVNTSYGWTWVSGYKWGWATFHYGRWDFDNYLGWVWIPGYEWAPAWVSWGSYGDCWGWAPLGPNIRVQANIGWFAPSPWWTFVPRGHFYSDNWNNYIYDRPVYVTNITQITNVYVNNNSNNTNNWYYGPRVNDVEKYAGSRVRTMEVVESERSDRTGVNNNRVSVYRPAVENRGNNERPTEYRNEEQVRRGATTLTTNPRLINPGENRTRENRSATTAPSRNSEIRTRNENQANPSGTRTPAVDPGSRNSNVNTNTREPAVEPRTGTSRQVQGENRRETPAPARNQEVINRNAPVNVSTRVEEPANTRTKTSEPTRENAGNTVSRKTEERPAATVQPERKTETRTTSPDRSVRVENSRKAEAPAENTNKTEEVKRGSNTERSSGGNPARR